MALIDRIQKDMAEAMKARDEARLNALRLVKSALFKYRVDSGKALDEKTELQILNTLIKQRRESAELFRTGGRPEMAEKEEAELKLLESYMPAFATGEEIEAAIAAALSEIPGASLKQMGVVMKAVQAKLAGKRIDGKALSDQVRSRLS